MHRQKAIHCPCHSLPLPFAARIALSAGNSKTMYKAPAFQLPPAQILRVQRTSCQPAGPRAHPAAGRGQTIQVTWSGAEPNLELGSSVILFISSYTSYYPHSNLPLDDAWMDSLLWVSIAASYRGVRNHRRNKIKCYWGLSWNHNAAYVETQTFLY